MEQVEVKSIQPRLLNFKNAARFLGIAEKTLRNRTHRKAVKPFPVRPKRIGSRVLFDVKDLEAYVDSLHHV